MRPRAPRKQLIGRKILCGHCNRRTVFGKIGLLNKVLFFFCSKCWADDAEGCMKQMCASASLTGAAVIDRPQEMAK